MNFPTVSSMVSFTCAILIIASSAGAATKGHIIPEGSVSLQKNGVVAKYNGQTVLDENALIACDGSCMVKMQGISLIAPGGTKFAVKESSGLINLYVGQGQVNFVIADPAQAFAFYTPDGRYVETEGFIVPASTDKSIKGFINVNETSMEIGMEKGSMIVRTDAGSRTVQPGQAIQLAQANVPSSVPTEKAASPKSGAFWSSLGKPEQIGIITVGAAAGIWAASETIFDSNDHSASRNQ
ncbi:MAG: hypothetical protein SCH71_09285 [Desulfobulbaceae bacterium]|nr:hypothetical protein [Desulfobulbaceae bacterium]